MLQREQPSPNLDLSLTPDSASNINNQDQLEASADQETETKKFEINAMEVKNLDGSETIFDFSGLSEAKTKAVLELMNDITDMQNHLADPNNTDQRRDVEEDLKDALQYINKYAIKHTIDQGKNQKVEFSLEHLSYDERAKMIDIINLLESGIDASTLNEEQIDLLQNSKIEILQNTAKDAELRNCCKSLLEAGKKIGTEVLREGLKMVPGLGTVITGLEIGQVAVEQVKKIMPQLKKMKNAFVESLNNSRGATRQAIKMFT